MDWASPSRIGIFLVAPVPIALEADQQAAKLPIIAPLQSADEAHRGVTVGTCKPGIILTSERTKAARQRTTEGAGGIEIIPSPSLRGAGPILALAEIEADIGAGPIAGRAYDRCLRPVYRRSQIRR